MNSALEVCQTSRNLLLKVLENHSLEQLNKIPPGFSNNLIWNVAHCVAAHQSLVYKLSGLPTQVSEEFITKYKKGSKPEGDVSQAEVAEVKELLFKTLQQTKEDVANGVFVNYSEYTTSMGFTLRNIEDALNFNNFHEGTHLGIIMSIRKLV
ncbi:DinB family protein [Flavobacterium sp. GA093]|uniref:DinB family protein n=1 Tax=Flavobacterium hydrocarbonoxydans TaxID=2683249 RepID=A0A6I4NG76_9FLAO|nr:DinB family protein [Flavobacterium hydrocarbonoxydans]MWB93566.1 DinB family protein [Flavobacterium hydrocarbonoxydans]